MTLKDKIFKLVFNNKFKQAYELINKNPKTRNRHVGNRFISPDHIKELKESQLSRIIRF